MSLREYARKRDFKRTPEPAPPAEPAAPPLPGGFFCVQRHRARRLHYDLRLEIGCTLKSWAVPKGPSLVPGVRSLAVHVEDHPLDYGNFEGNIPEGSYGAGSVMLWDRGTWELQGEPGAEEQLARGDLKFRLYGKKLRGTFALVHMKGRGKGDEWLLIKKNDEAADAAWDIEVHARSVLTGRSQEEIAADLPPADETIASRNVSPSSIAGAVKTPMPKSVEPMLATLATVAPEGGDWLYEIKWDGVRALCFVDRGQVRIVSRRGNSFDRQYPELMALPHHLDAETAVLDGEIVVFDEKGRSSFGLIQPRIGVTGGGAAAQLARTMPVTLFVFDLLYLDGYDLRQSALAERKRALRAILSPSERVRYSEHFEAGGRQVLEAARENGLEGILAKRAGSRYESRRSPDWVKIKVVNQQEFIICGFSHGERERFASLVLGLFEDTRLVYVGNAGTGFDARTIEGVWAKLEPLITNECPFAEVPGMVRHATWLRPELVCEVKFAEWTREGRLRAPVFVGLRPDLEPEEVVREGSAETVPTPAASYVRPPFLPAGTNQTTVDIDGRTLKFTNLDKVFYPREGYTKRDLLTYYNAVANLILPHLEDRPLSLKRYPDGIEGEYFFQKDIDEKYPKWLHIEPVPSEHRGQPIRFVIANDRATLLYLANLGCIDQNPWMSRAGNLECPDFVLIDLDSHGAAFDLIVEAALLVRRLLDRIGLAGYPKTTGGDGMHIFIPVEPRYSYEQTRSFAEILAVLAVRETPELFTTPRSVSKREKGKVYFDYLQNASGKTISSVYSPRANPGAAVATPLDWREVKRGLSPGEFTIRTVLPRFERTGDLFRAVLENRQALEPAIEKLEAQVRSAK